jgi:hypothetical protein
MRDGAGNPVYKKFRVLEGRCSIATKTDEMDFDGTAIVEDRIYRAREQTDPPEFTGDLFISNFDFCEYNQPGIPPKFALAGDGTIHPQGPHVSPLDKQPGETGEQFQARMRILAQEAMQLAGHPDFATPNTVDAAPSQQIPSQQSVEAQLRPDPRVENSKRLDEMSKWDMQRIRKWAADEEVDLRGAKDKNEAIKVLKEFFNLN